MVQDSCPQYLRGLEGQLPDPGSILFCPALLGPAAQLCAVPTFFMQGMFGFWSRQIGSHRVPPTYPWVCFRKLITCFCGVLFPDMPCMNTVYKDKRAPAHFLQQ